MVFSTFLHQCWRIQDAPESADANGNGPDKGIRVSVFVQLLPGEHDDQLKWPFQGEITVQLVQRHGADDWERKVLFPKTTPLDSSGRVAESKMKWVLQLVITISFPTLMLNNQVPTSYIADHDDSFWFNIKVNQ